MRHHDANDLIDQGIDIGPAHQLASPLLDPDAQEPRLGFGDTLLRPLIAPTVEPGRAAIADSASGRPLIEPAIGQGLDHMLNVCQHADALPRQAKMPANLRCGHAQPPPFSQAA